MPYLQHHTTSFYFYQHQMAQATAMENERKAAEAAANIVAQLAAEGKVDVGFQEALKKTESVRPDLLEKNKRSN